ncbi:hypothetical protein V2W30_39375 [Streptomyces sp. Q6]|uniref:Uncharacterized protein n=2 Tax=Streptomyces citrinus TaxID=3118173 RepID=A0ACD5ANP8_9ACTN
MLHRDGRYLDCHEAFQRTFVRDVEAAMDWAEQIIGTRLGWLHTRVGGPDRWTAVHNPQEDPGTTSADAAVLRVLEPGTLIVAVGAAGSEESTLASALDDVAIVVCLDVLREEISGCFSVKFSVLSSGDVRPLTERSGGPSTDENE